MLSKASLKVVHPLAILESQFPNYTQFSEWIPGQIMRCSIGTTVS